jgi:hypothetical protein
MTFKEELMADYTQAQVEGLKDDIRRASAKRYYRVLLSKADVKARLFHSGELVGHGKVMWDQLVQLGFEPHFEWNGGFSYLWIEW